MVDPIPHAGNAREIESALVQAEAPLARGTAAGTARRNRAVASAVPDGARLHISRDETTGDYIYRTVDRDTGEMIKQWPREDMLRLRRYLHWVAGRLLDRRI